MIRSFVEALEVLLRTCRRMHTVSMCCLLSILLASCTRPTPNILLVYVDDLGWRDLGVQGSDFYQTPNIDRLAAQGLRFTDAYANAPNCAPSRAALMSGTYAPRTGMYTVASAARGESALRKLVPVENETTLSLDVVTIAEALRSAGYATGPHTCPGISHHPAYLFHQYHARG